VRENPRPSRCKAPDSLVRRAAVAGDSRANDQALVDGSRILSAYRTLKNVRIWIITEAVGDDGKREATTILLPEQY
jgi:hypothetical protein